MIELSIKVLVRLPQSCVVIIFCLNIMRLEILSRQKYPAQTATAATLIAAGDLVKSLPTTIWAIGKFYSVAIPVSPIPILPIYHSTSSHLSMLSSLKPYRLPHHQPPMVYHLSRRMLLMLKHSPRRIKSLITLMS